MKRARATGFTLMELLIVVIIVGILAALALPQFARATRRARSAEAINIVGSLLTAEWVQFQENDEFTAVMGDLLVDIPPESDNENFNYTVAVAEGPPTTATATATGEADTNVDGVTVTGTIREDGTRQITTTGL